MLVDRWTMRRSNLWNRADVVESILWKDRDAAREQAVGAHAGKQVEQHLRQAHLRALLGDDHVGGHGAFEAAAEREGDAVLRHIGARLQSAAGPAALVGRIGGEEFAVWLPVGDEVSALRLAEDLRRGIAAKTIAVPDHPALSATVSIGATCGRGLDIDAALHRADRAMYRAKHDGRNLVRFSA